MLPKNVLTLKCIKPLLLVFILSLFLVSCAPPAPPDSMGGENESSQTGNGQTIYFPVYSNDPDNFVLPSEAPLPEWTAAGGVIPIMPGAIAGQTLEVGYAFTTAAGLSDIETYYLQELANRGWDSLSIGESDGVKDLLFQLGETRLTIHIEVLATENLSYVVIDG